MNIMGIEFDNTLQVKMDAIHLNKTICNKKGNEKQMYFIGDEVITTNLSPINFNGKIVEIYIENGYFRYVVLNMNTKEKYTFRTKDIMISKSK